jgi:hypothetical protein
MKVLLRTAREPVMHQIVQHGSVVLPFGILSTYREVIAALQGFKHLLVRPLLLGHDPILAALRRARHLRSAYHPDPER